MLALMVLATSLPARADDASEAQLQFELGSELYRQRRYLEAVERFLASYRLVANANVAFNIAQTYSLLDRRADAYNWTETVLASEAPANVRDLATRLRDRLAPRLAVIEVTSEPAGAEIFVDRIDLGSRGTAPRRIAVDAGARRIIARRAGHHETAADATATVGAVTAVRIELTPIVASVTIVSAPPGATVMDASRRLLGSTPLTVELPVGTHALTASLAGHRDATTSVTVDEQGGRREIELQLAAESSSLATLTVSGGPAGARVQLGDRDLGNVPLTRSDLPPGRTTLRVEAPGTEAWETELVLEAGSATRAAVQLRPPPTWSWPTLRTVLYIGAGVAVAGGTALGILALSAESSFYDDPTRNGLDSIGTYALAADLALGTGIVLGVSTFVLNLLLEPPPGTEGRLEVER